MRDAAIAEPARHGGMAGATVPELP